MSHLSIFGKSKAIEFVEATDGTLTIAKQEEGFGKAVTAEITGNLSGGKTCAVGAAKLLTTVGIAFTAAALEGRRTTGQLAVPFGLFA